MSGLSYLRHLLEDLAIASDCVDEALTISKSLALFFWYNDDGVMSSEALEQALLDRFGADLFGDVNICDEPHLPIIHVVSEIYDTGGHTLLLRQIAEAQHAAGEQPSILCLKRTRAFSFDAFGIPQNQVLIPQQSYSDRWTLPYLAKATLQGASRAKTVVLHIHPDDIGAALAARLLRRKGRKVFFVNHADHVFSFGPGAADAVLEISGWGWKVTSKKRASRAQHFLGIPAVIAAKDPSIEATPVDLAAPIVSMGSSGKYQPSPGNDFPSFLIELLAKVRNSVELVGPRATDSWWARLRELYPDRVIFHGPLPFDAAARIVARASCYVDSFPQGGGTAFTQAFMAGKIVFGPNRENAGGSSIVERLRSASIGEMTEEIVAFLKGSGPDRHAEFAALRNAVVEDFSADAVRKRLNLAILGQYQPPPATLMACERPLDYFQQINRFRPVRFLPLQKLLKAPNLSETRREQLRQALTKSAGLRL
jgi:hypothetical protein